MVEQSAWLETLGRLHVAVVHFPIALLMIAGLIEAWAAVRGKQRNPATVMLLTMGLAAALLAAVSGWFHGGTDTWSFDVRRHFIAGVAATSLTLLALLAVAFRQKSFARVMIFAAAIGVGLTGHFGGELTHGQGYLTELIFPRKAPPSPSTAPTTAPVVMASSDSAAGQAEAEYEAKVKPILAAACFECHGPAKHSASLRLDSLMELHAGGKSGVVVVAGKSDQSLLIQRVLGLGGKKRMPPERDPLSPEQIAVLREWIDKDRTAPTVVKKKWIATVEPVRPPVTMPIDSILAQYYPSHGVQPTGVVDDRTYARRVYLDVVGMLPTPEELAAFEADDRPDKRNRLVRDLLNDDRRYAENWMSFWNDALRNDYQGTGYIDGGRKQITQWLYKALAENMPFDEFVTQLIDPVPDSEGFAKGIVWRGAVSQSQRPEMQAAQNISQVFLGINMKCASCHDSFINDWKLADAYGLASVFAEEPLALYRCEKETGETAKPKFIYSEVGEIDPAAPKAERTKQLAELMTSPDNGRLARTIVNRLWARFMGHGLVEPVDEMDNEPWNIDLLNHLAVDLMDHDYDLKHTIMAILTSQAYQLPAVGMQDPTEKEFVFRGPVVRRMSAEQFCDSINQLTGGGYLNAAPAIDGVNTAPASGKWIWRDADALTSAPAGSILLWKRFDVKELPIAAAISVSCDNESVVYLNGHEVARSEKFNRTVTEDVLDRLVTGSNVLFVRATNGKGAKGANPAGFWADLSMKSSDGKVVSVGSDESWSVRHDLLDVWPPAFDRTRAKVAAALEVPEARRADLDKLRKSPLPQYRSVWARNDPLMMALGRPNREQVVTQRASAATTLQALELTNGQTLAEQLAQGGNAWAHVAAADDAERIGKLFVAALSRKPTDDEVKTATELAGAPATPEGLSDLIWALLMMPEFQLIY